MNIVSTFTRRNIARNRKRTFVTIIGVMLSTALICTVVGMVATFRHSIIEDYKENVGDWHVCLGIRSEDQYDTVMQNAHVEKAGSAQNLWFSPLDEDKYLSIYGCNEALFSQMNVKLKEGRLPENSTEMVISTFYARREGAPKVGDTVTLTVGDRMIRDDYGNEYPFSGWSYAEEEVFDPKGEQTYTVVGIVDTMGAVGGYNAYGPSGYVLEDTFQGKYTQLFIRVDIPSRFSEIMAAIRASLTAVEDGEYDVDTNMLVRFEGGFSDQTLKMILGLGVVISLIIVGTSAFVISNSFRISVEDKKTQFGMLASVGATKRQIRGMVFREAFYIFAIGTAAGVALGAFVVWILDQVVNLLVGDIVAMKMYYTYPWWVVVFSILLSAVTIFISAFRPARAAARITPIDIIRGGSDIRLDPEKLSSGRLARKFFGIGGVIAQKNLKRSKKKYRTTVVSLVIAVAVFIAISGFVSYGRKLVGEVYTEYDSNLMVRYTGGQVEDGGAAVRAAYDRVKNLPGIRDYFYGISLSGMARTNVYGSPEEKGRVADWEVPEELSGKADSLEIELLKQPYLNFEMILVPEKEFRAYLEKLGMSGDSPVDTAILADRGYDREDGVKNYRRISSLSEGDTLEFVYSKFPENVTDETAEYDEVEPEWAIGSCRIGKLVDEEELPIGLSAAFHRDGGMLLLISEKYFEGIKIQGWYSDLFCDAEDPDEAEKAIEAMNNDEDRRYNVSNLLAQQQANDRMILVMEIFLYGFIIVITLIGVTNVYNTIYTNMNLRSREFAMLRSVGMTKKEFVRMIRAEGILYSLKSLVIGLPLGIVLSLLVYLAVRQQFDYGYFVPWGAMGIAVIAVAVIVGFIMWISVRRVRKQNIIETIRRQNY